MSNGEVLAIIPARGGSKSIPKKNIIELLGKPLIAWTIQHGLASHKIDRLIVSTDSEEIANISTEFGAEVPFIRPVEYSADHSKDIEFHLHALKWLSENENYKPFAIVNLRPTTPLRKPNIIDSAIQCFLSHDNADSLRSVHIANQTPFKMWTIEKKGYLKQVAKCKGFKEPFNEPRQKLPFVYWQNGYIDIVKTDVVIKQKSTSGKLIIPFIVEDPSIDIDYPDEKLMAERQLRQKLESTNMISDSQIMKNQPRYPS